MARTYIIGWETGHVSDAIRNTAASTGVTSGNAAVSTEQARTGTYSLKVNPASGASAFLTPTGFSAATYHRFYVKVTARPASTARMLAGSSGGIHIRLNPDGTLDLYNGVTLVGSSTTALTDTTRWYRVEMRTVGTATSVPVLIVDGTTEITASPSAWNSALSFGTADSVADTYTAYFDDCVGDDSAFPGDGNVALLVPVSDNSVGTGWSKNGAANAVNLFSSVDNVPPVGVADASTGTTNAEKQIRNASSAAASYVANMTDYTTAGVGASDTINAVQSFVIVGAPVSTGAKTGSQQITANPAAGSATAFAANSAQYWTGTAAGTFPTGWKREVAAVVSSPSVILGNSPTLSLNITGGTASRIADNCFLGIYVDYTPAAATNVTAEPSAASLTTTGSAPTIRLNKIAAPTAASLTTTASAPTVLKGTLVAPAAASLATSGSAPTVTATANVTVTPVAASLATSASAPTVATTDHKTVLPVAASLATSASAPTVTATDNKTVTPSAASLVTTASAPTVTATDSPIVQPAATSLTTTASAPDVVTPVSVQPSAGALTTTGSAPILAAGVVPSQAALSTTASTPTVAVSDYKVAQPAAASLTTSASAPAVATPVAVAPSAAALVTTGSAPEIVNPASLEPIAPSLTLTGDSPAVSVTDSSAVVPDAASLTLTAEAPAVVTPTTVEPVAASLSLAGEAPDVAAPALSEPAAAEMIITASEPVVTLPVQVTPDAVDLTLTSATPALAAGGDIHVVPTARALTLVGKRPVVQAVHARPRIQAIGSAAGLDAKPVPRAPRPRIVRPKPTHLSLVTSAPQITMIDDGDIMQILALIA